ncbi:hypothetical protein TWF696_002543 [Orbilia brochopaga]|uniref:Uncharacterized protein n=1 Tax=Orbilia brochopaga TaxID=3140254 RepID=A0AAV9U1K6_9PEZI
MQPANSKNRVYAMWDFVGRTMGMINNIQSPNNLARNSVWKDVVGRSIMANMLIQDESKGDQMHQMTWRDGFDRRFPFGDEVKQASEAAANAAE